MEFIVKVKDHHKVNKPAIALASLGMRPGQIINHPIPGINSIERVDDGKEDIA